MDRVCEKTQLFRATMVFRLSFHVDASRPDLFRGNYAFIIVAYFLASSIASVTTICHRKVALGATFKSLYSLRKRVNRVAWLKINFPRQIIPLCSTFLSKRDSYFCLNQFLTKFRSKLLLRATRVACANAKSFRDKIWLGRKKKIKKIYTLIALYRRRINNLINRAKTPKEQSYFSQSRSIDFSIAILLPKFGKRPSLMIAILNISMIKSHAENLSKQNIT